MQLKDVAYIQRRQSGLITGVVGPGRADYRGFRGYAAPGPGSVAEAREGTGIA